MVAAARMQRDTQMCSGTSLLPISVRLIVFKPHLGCLTQLLTFSYSRLTSKLLGPPTWRPLHSHYPPWYPILLKGIITVSQKALDLPDAPPLLRPFLSPGAPLSSTFISFPAFALQNPNCSLRQFNATSSKQSSLMAQGSLSLRSCSTLPPMHSVLDENVSFPLP